MDTRCILCDQPTSVRVIGAMVVTGNPEHPDGEVLCRRCAALLPEERQLLRDQAMARMLRAGVAPDTRRDA